MTVSARGSKSQDMTEERTARRTQLEAWIAEAEDALDSGLPLVDDDGSQLTMESTRTLLSMWRDELAQGTET